MVIVYDVTVTSLCINYIEIDEILTVSTKLSIFSDIDIAIDIERLLL